jgi:hypothetical protein
LAANIPLRHPMGTEDLTDEEDASYDRQRRLWR